eukprot:TRINITY_DN1158_c0_g3_i1.p1 TRINITY_DN1158_c0_g3~~TRINITY_DN1158_c0_g3_i1.p1  ORF type:complete len:260 (+),score=34.23 TRINITY_DN1158_c0_g3_i1:58-837(+)
MTEPSNQSWSEVCDLVIRNTFYELVDRTAQKERNSRKRTRSLNIDRGRCSSKSESESLLPAGMSLVKLTATPSARDDRVEVADAGSKEPRLRHSSSAAQTSNSSVELTSFNRKQLCVAKERGSFNRALKSPETELIKYKALLDGATTVMVQNMLKDVTQAYFEHYVVRVLGFGGQFDFLYMPTCFETGISKGYGFVNFLTSDLAAAFMVACAQHKICATRADLQGREAYVSQFSKRSAQRVRNKNHKPIMLNPNGLITQ